MDLRGKMLKLDPGYLALNDKWELFRPNGGAVVSVHKTAILENILRLSMQTIVQEHKQLGTSNVTETWIGAVALARPPDMIDPCFVAKLHKEVFFAVCA
jgi:hypothetical protein